MFQDPCAVIHIILVEQVWGAIGEAWKGIVEASWQEVLALELCGFTKLLTYRI